MHAWAILDRAFVSEEEESFRFSGEGDEPEHAERHRLEGK